MSSFTLPAIETTVFLLIDMQEKLLAAMNPLDTEKILVRQKIMLNVASELNIPVMITEQYPRGLGKTVAGLSVFFKEEWPVFDKTSFSCFGDVNFRREIERRPVKSLVLMGVETHVCIQQTAIDALARGFRVFVVSDAVNSKRQDDAATSIDFMRGVDAHVTSSESLIFALLKDASHPSFKKIVSLLK
ncbi:MAG: isochorismatase family protein [Victivallales bacterium]|jgi:nicotinamidase-related amidase